MQKNGRRLLLSAMALGVLFFPLSASALINLELRPGNQTVAVGAPADLGLYAVSDSGVNQLMSAADVLFTWDPTKLDLLGNDDTGAVLSLSSGFPTSDPWGNINQNASFFDPPTGGTGYYAIKAFFGAGNAIVATPAGTLLTTFLLDALAPTPDTVFSIVMNADGPDPHGAPGKTSVYDGTTPNLDVTGTLGVAHITILPEPTALMLLLVGAATVGCRRRGIVR